MNNQKPITQADLLSTLSIFVTELWFHGVINDVACEAAHEIIESLSDEETKDANP